MYTQCPDCSTAFRVTADVLKQAAGQVRCGGCRSAFNALEYLSEDMPEQPAAKESESPLPELTPDPMLADDGSPLTISAEQSAALLKTLDELAGSDIRIEDTGIEWRVLDEDELSQPADEEVETYSSEADLVVDELLDESPTPVDQFLTQTPNDIEASEIFDESANAPAQTPVEELRFDDNTPLPDDFNLDDESSYLPESADEDIVELEEGNDGDTDTATSEDVSASQDDVEIGDSDDWADILGEVAATEEPDEVPLAAELEAPGDAPLTDGGDAIPGGRDDAETPPDVDTQFALQAEAMGIDLSGISTSSTLEEQDENREAVAERHEELGADEETGEHEELDLDDASTGASGDDLATELAADSYEEGEASIEEPLGDEDSDLASLSEPDESEDALLEFGSVEKAIAELEEQSDVFDKDFFAEAVAPDDEPQDEDEKVGGLEGEEIGHFVPPQSEEEQNLNLMIDQELLELAVEDEDGFASTIIIPEKDAESHAIAEKIAETPGADASVGFESIVMEGESVRSALESEKRAADIAAAAELIKQAKKDRETQPVARDSGNRRGMLAAAVLLALSLMVQIVHQSREALATIPAFNEAIGPVYRAIGRPLTPTWDVTGWRFEARRDILDEEADTLTVISRVGNTSAKALPYPVINVSLIDRFDETIGNKTLDPSEYLTDDLDPGQLVPPGNNFTALMSIDSPSQDATGYKLQACYRLSDARLRCHVPDFK